MRSSCIAACFSPLALLAALPAGADSLGARLGLPPPDPVLVYELRGDAVAIMPRDVAGIEISESGGITDIFLRLEPEATGVLAAITTAGLGAPLVVRACGTVMLGGRRAGPDRQRHVLYPRHQRCPRRGDARALAWPGAL